MKEFYTYIIYKPKKTAIFLAIFMAIGNVQHTIQTSNAFNVEVF